MKFEIIKDKEKLEKKRRYLADKYPYSLESFGKVVGYEMPALALSFPQLASWLEKSLYPREFWGIEYYVATNGGSIDRIIPAAEYYKVAFRSISDDLHSARLNNERIELLQVEINEAFRTNGRTMASSGHSFFNASTFVYSLKSELASFFFFSRSLLDTVATLMHFFYGPKSGQYRSFTDFTKRSVEDRSVTGDSAMKDYLEKYLGWYNRLKDMRDYLTHYKSLDIGFYEQPDKTIKIYLEDRFEIQELMTDINTGIIEFLHFIDEHFKTRLESGIWK